MRVQATIQYCNPTNPKTTPKGNNMTIDTDTFEFRNVFHDNPYLFMADFEQAVKDGYRVVNNLKGYPRLQGMLKEVRMFRDESIPSEVATDVENYKEVVVDYDPMFFLMKCQATVLAGYEVDLKCGIGGIRFDTPYKCTFCRTEEADIATVEAMLEGLPEIDIEPEDVVESVHTEAEKPRRRATRKSK